VLAAASAAIVYSVARNASVIEIDAARNGDGVPKAQGRIVHGRTKSLEQWDCHRQLLPEVNV
jgi:hypothetical protein